MVSWRRGLVHFRQEPYLHQLVLKLTGHQTRRGNHLLNKPKMFNRRSLQLLLNLVILDNRCTA